MKTKTLLLVGILFFLLALPFPAGAQSPGPTPVLTDTQAIFTLADVGYRERTLMSPRDVTRVRFNVPPGLHLLAGGEFDLEYDVVLSGADANKIVDNKNPYGGNLVISLNNTILQMVPLDEIGTHSTRISIPSEAWVSSEVDGSHLLSISLSAQFSCMYDLRAMITIKSTSFLTLSFENIRPQLSLAKLPAPFFIRNSFIPEATLVVIPDSPDPLEMQAALDLMTGLGSAMGNLYDIQLVTAGQLDANDLTKFHLVFVGMPTHLDVLSKISLSLPVIGGQFVKMPPDSVNDGVLELAYSPWNPNKAILLVSGNSGSAVILAAQAVSSGNVLIYKDSTLAYVSQVQTVSQDVAAVEDFNFQNLGYGDKTLSGVGVSSTDYYFYISKEQVPSSDAYLDLVYYHSGLLNYGSSSFSIQLNRRTINSTAFSEDSDQVTTLRIKFPPGLLQLGENSLTISASMPQFIQANDRQACDHSGLANPWLTISQQSQIHIPVTAVLNPPKLILRDLKLFSDRVSTDNQLGDVAFILPASDPVSWAIAGKLAFNLGNTYSSALPHLAFAYADSIPAEIRASKTLIVIGIPSRLPLLTEFNDLLPAPFDFTANTANQRNMQIDYRIPAGVGVGYLELIPSPYNPEKAILLVAGNSKDGLLFAGNALLVSELRSQLGGVFAVTNGLQIATGSAALPAQIATVIPDSVVTATPLPQFVSEAPAASRPSWPLPVLMITGLMMVVMIGFAIRAVVLRKHPAPSPPATAPDVENDHETEQEQEN